MKSNLTNKNKFAVFVFYYSIGAFIFVSGYFKRLLRSSDHKSKWLKRKQDQETVSSAGRQY